LQDLPDKRAVDDALEFMKTDPQVDRDVPRYHSEVVSLERRQNLIVMREVLLDVQSQVKSMQDVPSTLSQKKEQLLKEAQELMQYAKIQERVQYEFFPVTDYIKVSDRDPKGVVRVNYYKLNKARRRGMENEHITKFMPMIPPSATRDQLREYALLSYKGLEGAYEEFIGHVSNFREEIRDFEEGGK